MRPDNKRTTLATITENTEEKIARLYQAYSDKFPEFADFWSGLVVEQIDHINLIHGIMNRVSSGLLKCSEDRLDCTALEILQNRVEQEITRVKEGKISAGEAFFIALEIEKAVSKREYSEALVEDSGEVKTAFSHLAANSQKRIKWIEKHLNAEKE